MHAVETVHIDHLKYTGPMTCDSDYTCETSINIAREGSHGGEAGVRLYLVLVVFSAV